MRSDQFRGSIIVAALIWAAMSVMTAASQQQKPQQPQQQKPEQQKQQPAQQQQQAQQGKSQKVDLDALEDHPEKFLGKTVTVDGEVDRVLGPHLFTIDERHWADPERELPVVVPEPFTALVKKGAPVTVTGTVQKVPIAQIEREHGFLSKDEKIRAEIETQPVLLAHEVTATTDAKVSLRMRAEQPVGTSGASSGAPITDASQVAAAKDTNMVGRRVDLKDATVTSPTEDGFWIRLPSGERIFVMPAKKTTVREGQTAAVEGVILELPEGLQVKVNGAGEPIYIYAERVTPR